MTTPLNPADTAQYSDVSDSGIARAQLLVKLTYPLIVICAFGLYWMCAVMLESNHAASNFGSDSVLYVGIAYGNVQERLTRFHPATVGLAIVWMKLITPFSGALFKHHLLWGLFAAIGAAGVWAALSAFEKLVPRRYVLICGLIYAVSFGVWFFASTAESKILTATLATAYIAIYLRLRERWTVHGTLALMAVLGAACLNEIVSALLLIIPVLDIYARRRTSLADMKWVAPQIAVVALVYLAMSAGMAGESAAVSTNPEGNSFSSMFWFYVGITSHSWTALYGFMLNWLFFNIAAPTATAYASTPEWSGYFGYFEPSFMNYFNTLVSTSLVGLTGLMAVTSLAPGWRSEGPAPGGIIWPLMAYSSIRALFFFIFNPPEVMLFSSAATLPHLVLLLAPFAASKFPAKTSALLAFAALLFATNLRFMIGVENDSAIVR